jgi:hypothetical protein
MAGLNNLRCEQTTCLRLAKSFAGDWACRFRCTTWLSLEAAAARRHRWLRGARARGAQVRRGNAKICYHQANTAYEVVHMPMQVIETNFDGHLFRSRTEARWAVFFKAATIRYEYEKEGFNFSGRWYLPDFWLPEMGLWFEVKGDQPTAEEQALCRELSIQSRHGVLLAVGAPEPQENVIWFPSEHEQEDPFSGGRYCLADDRKNDGEFCLMSDSLGWFSIGGAGTNVGGRCHDKWPLVHSATKRGYEAARAARFEHRLTNRSLP